MFSWGGVISEGGMIFWGDVGSKCGIVSLDKGLGEWLLGEGPILIASSLRG